MFLPIGDYPNPPGTPWLTRALVAVNVAVFLFVSLPMDRPLTQEELQDPEVVQVVRRMLEETETPARGARNITRYDVYVWDHGYKPADPSLLDLFHSMFLHGGFLHLAGNMLFLWIFGNNVELWMGRLGYAIGYLATGVAATLFFAMFESDSLTPMVGASGAISGVLGFYLVWFPHNQIRVLFFFFFVHMLHVRAYWALLFYLVVQNLLPFFARAADGVAYGAHIGGFVAGMAGAWILDRVRGRRPTPRPSAPSWQTPVDTRWVQRPHEPARVEEAPQDLFRRAVAVGRMEDAAHAFARVAREGGAPPDPADVFELGRWLYENDFHNDAAAVFRYYIKNYPRGEDLDRVHLGLGILLARSLGSAAAAREHLLTAIDLADDARIAETARDELRRLD